MNIPILQVSLRNDQDLITARQRTKAVAEKAALGHQDQNRLITAVSEIARNALMYAGGGKMRLSILSQDGAQYIQAQISDDGDGIKNLESIMSGHYVSRTGLGKGIAGSKRIVDLFEISTSVMGTTVVLGKLVNSAVPAITSKTVQEWLSDLHTDDVTTPLDELQEQNKQLMQTLDELNKVSTDLAEASRQKGRFLANISHEIRTPLNAILGLNKLLSRTALTPEQQRFVKLSREAGQTLLALINDVLDLSKIESGKMEIHNVEFDLNALTSSIVDMFSIQANEKGIELCLLIDPNLPPSLIGDDLRIKQILVNLIGNAVKFSEHGKVLVDLVVLNSDSEKCRVRFTVSDNGPGISAEQQKKLFQAFSQADASASRQHGGTGLGLAISQLLVNLMQGEIGLQSAVGKGSIFWFEVPLTIGSGKQSTKNTEESVPPFSPMDLGGRLILIAEDHPVNRLVAATELEELGFQVHLATNGEEACELAAKTQYDLIFMDCQMPVMDGYAATKQIRRANNDVPIVAMTANALEGDRERCLEAGMNDYITKPFDQEDLHRAISRWVIATAPIDRHEPAIDVTALRKRFKPANLDKLIPAFRGDLPASVSKLRQAIEAGDLPDVARKAHALRGACAMVFAQPLANLCTDIEQTAKSGDAAHLEALGKRLDDLAREADDICATICVPQAQQ